MFIGYCAEPPLSGLLQLMFPVLLPFCLLSSPNVQLVPASALKLHPSITAIIFCDNFLFTALYSPPMKQETLSCYVQHVKEEKSWQYVTVLAVIEFSVTNTKRLILRLFRDGSGFQEILKFQICIHGYAFAVNPEMDNSKRIYVDNDKRLVDIGV